MNQDSWTTVTRVLDETAEAGETLRVWLRDDDAITETAALHRLEDLCGAAALPILLAVIPARADDRLAAVVRRSTVLAPCQHGWQHKNHAEAGQRACELGGPRPSADILAELAEGRRRLLDLFSDRLETVLVPPWNRIDAWLIEHLPGLGFTALSTFGPPPADSDGVARINCDVDIIDWRHGRIGRSATDVAGKLADVMTAARHHRRPVGILTHHLAHDAQAWSVLDDMIDRLARHPGSTFVRAVQRSAPQA